MVLKMKRNPLYSQNTQIVIRITFLISIMILVIANTSQLKNLGIKQLIIIKHELLTFVVNCIAIVLFSLFPTKIGMLSFISFLYGTLIIILEPQNNMGILMMGLSIIVLYARGVFNKHKIIILIVFIACIASELRFGKEVFFGSLFEKLAYLFILFYVYFFFKSIHLMYLKQMNRTVNLIYKNFQN